MMQLIIEKQRETNYNYPLKLAISKVSIETDWLELDSRAITSVARYIPNNLKMLHLSNWLLNNSKKQNRVIRMCSLDKWKMVTTNYTNLEQSCLLYKLETKLDKKGVDIFRLPTGLSFKIFPSVNKIILKLVEC